jgi:uncharacterized protein (DUF169 family)
MNSNQNLYRRLITAFDVDHLQIPATLVKLYKAGETIPEQVRYHQPEGISVTSCQAHKQSSLGDAVCLTRENIGCVAAAISLGLVDKDEKQPLGGARVYTDLMKEQAKDAGNFHPPTPSDFTEGYVYACQAANRLEFCLFGKEDSGRYRDLETARKAISEMTAIQPADMQAVFFYPPDFEDLDLEPDLVLLSVRPVELTRIVQAYQFMTGKRVNASLGALRMVNSDLIARPYLTGEINVSSYCLGARLIARFDPDLMGMGIPFEDFKIIVDGMEESKSGYPFHLYPGAAD